MYTAAYTHEVVVRVVGCVLSQPEAEAVYGAAVVTVRTHGQTLRATDDTTYISNDIRI